MKTITSYLLKFALTITLLTIIFRYFLSYGIENHSTITITLSAVIYFLSMFASGMFFGKKDKEYLPIFDVGFRFHFTTYLIHNGISLLWLGLELGAKYEKLNLSLIIAIYWGIFLFIHFIFYLWTKKNTIDNLNKEDLFE